MEIKRKCIACGEQFTITEEEQDRYRKQGFDLPKRCKSCRKERREEDAFFEDEMRHLIVEAELERRRVSRQTVKHKHFDKPLQHRVKDLFLIGNGFDIWCGLDTRYSDFKAFYEKHKIQISWDLGIEPCEALDDKGNAVEVFTQFDLLYFALSDNIPNPLAGVKDFWSDFENSLLKLDDVAINMYFGKEIEDLKDIRLDCDYSYEVIRKSFSEWIKGIDCDGICVRDRFRFADSLFVNFNYTDTLTRRAFGVDENDIIHIHGKASDEESIIFGHGKRVTPEPISMQMGRRFAGRYIIETIQEKYYKDPPAQWKMFLQRLRNKNADLHEVENIYVLGLSMKQTDAFYFQKLKTLLPQQAMWHFSCFTKSDRGNAKRLISKCKIENYKIYPTIEAALAGFKV